MNSWSELFEFLDNPDPVSGYNESQPCYRDDEYRYRVYTEEEIDRMYNHD